MSQDIEYITIPYDASARYCGVSNGCYEIKGFLHESENVYTLPREHNTISLKALSRRVAHLLKKECFPFIIGGDHSTTFYSYQAVCNCLGSIDIVVFDAHHDFYKDNILSHYSVFYHLNRLYGCNVYFTGVRKDLSIIDQKYICKDFSFLSSRRPIYLSIDMDFFSPDLVSSVMDPVDDKGRNTLEVFSNKLDSISSRIVACDLVEWKGASSTEEKRTVETIFELIKAKQC